MKTIPIVAWFVLCFVLVIIKSDGSMYEKCSISNNQMKYAILPGMGWDNLQNVEMGRVLDLQFSKCKYSDDNKFLLPNQISLYPKRSSEVELFSEVFEHFMNYTSTTSRSMNFKAEGFIKDFQLGGQFSFEKERVKSYQVGTKSQITRVQLRYNLYKSLFEPDTPLHPEFHDRIIQLAKWIKSFNETFYSSYLADMIIRDFGTHVIRSIDAGATLSKIDLLDSGYVKKYSSETTIIGASSSASFLKLFKLETKIHSKATEQQTEEYNRKCVKTIVKTYGGSPVGADLALEKWVSSLNENLVPIDRSGDPIYYVLNRKVLPNLSSNMIHKISNHLMDSVNRYYMANSRKGCLNLHSPNFNSDANLDGNKCLVPIVYFNFGGVFRTCGGRDDQCGPISNPNPLTGSYSCPSGFAAILLHSGLNECREYCHKHFIFWKKCHTDCSYFQMFWCYPLTYSQNHNGYRFGGFINSQMPACPIGYFPMNLGSTAQFCVTSDASPTNPYALVFGGFFSCSVGNPLARSFFKDKQNKVQSSPLKSQQNWLHDCADGYVAHIATIDRNCQISYCTESNKFTLGIIPNINRPPFFKVSYNENNTTSKVLYTKNGEMYTVNFNPNKIDDLMRSEKNRSIAATIFETLFGVLLFGVIVFAIIRKYRRKKSIINSEGNTNRYGALNETEDEERVNV